MRRPPRFEMVRLLYNLLLLLALPWVCARLFWKSRREPAYRHRIGERFGALPWTLPARCIWFHTVSAGEANAAAPVIRALREHFPTRPLLVTTMTPAGSARVTALLGDIARHCYAPYDYPWAVRRFLERVRPSALVLLETELWPNLVRQTASSGADVFLVNARLSERSYQRYRRIGSPVREMLRDLRAVVCQYEDTAERFRALGATAVEVTGSVKFDADLPPDRFGVDSLSFGAAPVWIAGSTHAGEEEIVVDAHIRLRNSHPDLRLILAPRHTARVPTVLGLLRAKGATAALLSSRETDASVLVADVMGTLPHLYGLADVAFVGGSLDRTGGHNPIEAAWHAVPMLMGPARFKIEEIWARFDAAGCAHEVGCAADIVAEVGALLDDPARRAQEGKRAQAVVTANRGARDALVDKLADWLS